MKQIKDSTTLENFITQSYGALGTEERNDFEEGYEAFKVGFLIQEARIKKGMTQEQLAQNIGMNKAYISKVENNLKDIRLSTLHKIIEGLGGHINLSISI